MSMWMRSSHTLPPSLIVSHWVNTSRYVLNTTCPHLQLILQNLPVEGLQRELWGQGTKPERAWLYWEIKAQGAFETWPHHHFPHPVFLSGKAAPGCVCNLPQVTQLLNCPNHYWKRGHSWLESLDPSLMAGSSLETWWMNTDLATQEEGIGHGDGAARRGNPSGRVHVADSHQAPFSPKLNCYTRLRRREETLNLFRESHLHYSSLEWFS